MPDDEALDNFSPTRSLGPRPRSGDQPADLQGEDSLRELISSGVPLPYILNRLRAAIDLQIGNVVSVIFLADDPEHDLQTIAQSAFQCRLHVFWSATIPLRDKHPLGYFEMYCSVPRTPSAVELMLIRRVIVLAGLAIRRSSSEPALERSYFHRKDAPRKTLQDGAPWN